MWRNSASGPSDEISAFCSVLFRLALRARAARGVEAIDEDQAFADATARERHVQGAREGASARDRSGCHTFSGYQRARPAAEPRGRSSALVIRLPVLRCRGSQSRSAEGWDDAAACRPERKRAGASCSLPQLRGSGGERPRVRLARRRMVYR